MPMAEVIEKIETDGVSPNTYSNFSLPAEQWNSLKHFVWHGSSHIKLDVDSVQDENFTKVLKVVDQAIAAEVYPQLIPNGCSGSYFVKNIEGKNIGIFKPRDEEPFASLNPKWPKFFQRILCFCCFGRACLIPNNGFLSEAGASLVDSRLELNIVPETRVVKLCSPTFYYGQRCGRTVEPRPKIGSFQVFVEGYESANVVLSEWNSLGVNNVMTPDETRWFTILFQKMCILDYVIRNTDRHLDNWLIRHVPNSELKIAAIDNGLAFPIKHPEQTSRFRRFPFDWATLGWARKQWDSELRDLLLNKLTPSFVDTLCRELLALFLFDKSHNRSLHKAQLHVMRGQLWNLRESLSNNESPFDLIKRKPVLVARKYHGVPTSTNWAECFSIKTEKLQNLGCC